MVPSYNTSGEDFGQKIDLTVRIREILRNYPEGTSILKELVQNADDAGAREVRLCLDLRHHGTSNLPSPALAQFQGPALLVYNNGVFTDTDFRCASFLAGASLALFACLYISWINYIVLFFNPALACLTFNLKLLSNMLEKSMLDTRRISHSTSLGYRQCNGR